MTKEEFLQIVNVRPEVLGTPALLMHFIQNTSSQRGLMSGNNLPQAEVIKGNETARFQTGFETKYGEYCFDQSSRDQDIQVVKVIPKFGISMGTNGVRNNPYYTVIYIGSDDNRIGYFDVSTYTELHAGFGYLNKKIKSYYPTEGDYISKDQKFYTAPNHDGRMYNLGLNVNVAFIPMWDTTDDAFVISKSLADKLTHTVINDVVINIKPDTLPLNLYGDDTIYNCFPDIGTTVRDDGILIALRRKDDNTFLTDLTASELCIPRHLHDDLFVAPPGAEILDVQVFINHKSFRQEDCDIAYTQLFEYQKLHYRYYAQVVDTYEELTKQGYKCNPSFSNFVTKCKAFCIYRGGKTMTLTDKKEPIEFIRLQITYGYEQHVSNGFKLTGTDGSYM